MGKRARYRTIAERSGEHREKSGAAECGGGAYHGTAGEVHIGQIQERSISQINGSSTTNSGAQRGNASSATVAHFTIPVKEKFSVEELPVSGQKILDA